VGAGDCLGLLLGVMLTIACWYVCVYRLSPLPGVVVMSAVVEVPQRLRLIREEMNSTKGAIAAWEDGWVATEHALGKACAKHDATCTQIEAIR
jgi:hypothetical protein